MDLGFGTIAWGLSKAIPNLARENRAIEQAHTEPGRLFIALPGYWVGVVADEVFRAQQYRTVEEVQAEADGVGRWVLSGELPDGTAYKYRFETLHECKSILAGMQIEFLELQTKGQHDEQDAR